MRLTSINVNGIRAATKIRSATNLGLLDWLERTDSDVVCIQETRADHTQLMKAMDSAVAQGWNVNLAESAIKGRNGVAVVSRRAPDTVQVGFGTNEFAASGRYIQVAFGTTTVGSLYLPSGEVGTERQGEKDRFREAFGAYLEKLRRQPGDAVVCGDWNIAHTEHDIKNWKGNLKNSGFLPEERRWITTLLDSGWNDVVRELHPGAEGPYTWWSFRGKAFDNDAGWRIDYHLANDSLARKATEAVVERAEAYDLRWSDHAPITVSYEGALSIGLQDD